MSDLTNKQRAALTALRDVMKEHDIDISADPRDGGFQVVVGVNPIDETWSDGCIDAFNLTQSLKDLGFEGTSEQLNKLNIGK